MKGSILHSVVWLNKASSAYVWPVWVWGILAVAAQVSFHDEVVAMSFLSAQDLPERRTAIRLVHDPRPDPIPHLPPAPSFGMKYTLSPLIRHVASANPATNFYLPGIRLQLHQPRIEILQEYCNGDAG